MMRFWKPLLIVVIVHLAAALAPAAADVIELYSDFGPGNTYQTLVGWAIAGAASSFGYRAQAQRFTPGVSANLSSIELPLGLSKGSGLCNISLVEDFGGYPTGAVLESFSNVSPSGNFGSFYPPRLLLSVAQPLLQAGVTYWLRAEPADSTVVACWNENNQGVADTFGFGRSPGNWDTVPGQYAPPGGTFRINAVPIPEPSAWGLVVLGSICLLGGRSLRRGSS